MARRVRASEAAETREDAPHAPGGDTPEATAGPVDDGALTRLIGYQVTRAEVRTRQAFFAWMGPLGLRPAEFSVLTLVAANRRLTQRALGEALDISAPNLAVILDRLSERGLLTRVRSLEDRRAQHPRLTAQGKALLVLANERAIRMEQAVFGDLTPGERAILAELLEKIARRKMGPVALPHDPGSQ